MAILDTILGLRPTDGTSTAIAAAIGRTREAQTDADARVLAARQERDAALLDADPKALAALERKLTEARDGATETAERVAAVLAQLEARLITTKQAETLATVAAAKRLCETAGSGLAEWWATAQPKLAAILRQGEELDTAATAAFHGWNYLATTARQNAPELSFDMPEQTGKPAQGWRDDLATMAEPLPRSRPVLVPDAEDVERVERRARSEAAYAVQNGPARAGRPT